MKEIVMILYRRAPNSPPIIHLFYALAFHLVRFGRIAADWIHDSPQKYFVQFSIGVWVIERLCKFVLCGHFYFAIVGKVKWSKSEKRHTGIRKVFFSLVSFVLISGSCSNPTENNTSMFLQYKIIQRKTSISMDNQ